MDPPTKPVISQKDYLKKYFSKSKLEKPKRKKLKLSSSSHLKRSQIIDDDLNLNATANIDDDEFNLEYLGDEAPQIAGIVDDRPDHIKAMEIYGDSKRWKAIDDGPASNSNKSSVDDTLQDTKKNDNKLSKNNSKEVDTKNCDSDQSHLKKHYGKEKEFSDFNKLSKTKTVKTDKNKTRSVDDQSPHRKNSEREKSNSTVLDDRSSLRKTNVNVKTKKGDIFTNRSPITKTDESRKRESDSDQSPPRRNHKYRRRESDSDQSPPRRSEKSRRKESDSDQSPPRRSEKSRRKVYDNDQSPPRRKDTSRRRKSDSDQSPPRSGKSRRKESDSDQSPPRRSNKSRRRESDSDQSPPRSDKSRRRFEEFTKNKYDAKCSNSGTKKKIMDDRSNMRSSDKHHSRNSDSDLSPPRKSSKNQNKDRNSIEKREKRDDKEKEKYFKSKTDVIKKPVSSEFKKGHSKEEKTLEGKKAGLQDAKNLREELASLKEQEDKLFKNMDSKKYGFGSKSVVRDRKTGRIKDLIKEQEESQEKRKERLAREEKYSKWGKGLKQLEDANAKAANAFHEMSKPLARYKDDEDLDSFLKAQEREGDPMLDYIRKKQKESHPVEKLKPRYEGSYAPNRFNIRPGHRWDGVDRSTGFEAKWFENINAKKALQEEAYKWSSADM